MKTEASALEALRDAAAHPYAAARRHHECGGTVVGYVSNNVPVELIVASGALPVEVRGLPHVATAVGDRYMEDFFDGQVRSIFSQAMEGQLSFLDLLIIPRSSEAYLQLYYYLQEARKWEKDVALPTLVLFDILQTPFWHSSRYDRAQVGALRDRLAHEAATAINDDAVRDGINAVNRAREALQRLNALRRVRPDLVPGSTLLTVSRALGALGPEAHAPLVEAVVNDLESESEAAGAATDANGGLRVLVKGTQHDDLIVYRVLEELGAHVVADDHVTGERAFDVLVTPVGPDPLEAIAHFYQFDSPSPRSYPQERQDARFQELARESSAEAVIFHLEENDDTYGWDYPEQKRLLDENGIASVYLPYQPYFDPDPAALRVRLEPFIDQLTAPARSSEEVSA